MNNRKGFTLVELLVSIAILSLVLVIAIPAYSKVSDAVTTNQRKSVITYLESAASKYAFDTGETVVFVDTLIKNNYVTPDNDLDEVTDPAGNGKMNCFTLKMVKEGDSYDATFVDKKYELKNGTCDESVIKKAYGDIQINSVNDNKIIDESVWVKGSVTLESTSNTIPINCNVSSCLWTSSTGANIKSRDSIVVSPSVGNSINAKYNFQITVTNSEGETNTYSQNIAVKIDNKNPQIYDSQVSYKDGILTIYAGDGVGSGVAEYAAVLGTDENITCRKVDLKYQKDNKFNITEPGNYILCVKDSVGNIGTSSYNVSN